MCSLKLRSHDRHPTNFRSTSRRQLPAKSEVALLQTLSRLFYLIHVVKYWQFFLELNSNRLHQSSGTEKIESRLVFTS